jgi:membrane protease YdiL (CAAX protease family)
MFERLGKLLGKTVVAKAGIVLLTSTLFALAHYAFQGMPGVEQAFIVGLVFGGIFAITDSLFLLMIAHAAFDLTALAVIFWDVEATLAHLIFE